MSKGLIIGMACLGVGLACLGGVGGYYLNSALTKTPTVQTENVAQAEESDFVDYALPEEFAYVSYSAYDIGEKFSLISSSSVGTYLLNKETSEFTFFNSSYVSTYSSEINGYKYFWLNNYNLFRINTETGEYEVVALNSGVSFTSLSFLDTSGNKLIMKGYSNSSYYLVAFNTKKGESEVYSLTSTQYSYSDVVIEINGKYFLSKLYSNSSTSGSTYSSYIIDQDTSEITTLSSYCLYSSSTYTIHGSKMYALMRYSSSYYYLCTIDFSDGTLTQISESTVASYGTFFELEKGILYAYKKSLNYSGWSSMYGYYISYTDDSVTILTQNDAYVYVCAIEVQGQLFLTPYTSSYTYATLATFNETTKEIETAYTVLVASSSTSMCSIYTFNDIYYVSSDTTNFARIDFDEDGNVTFTRVNLKCSITGTSYEIGDGKYLFVSEGVKYYDFENDVYKSLLSSSYSIKDLSVDGNIVTIYASNYVKYEFNTDTLTFKAVAYWESAE